MSEQNHGSPLLSPSPPVSSPEEDQALMRRLQGGDERAFQKIYEKYKRPIMNYLYAVVKNQAVAEDLVQETFLRVYRKCKTFDLNRKFTTWLWSIAHHLALDQLRKKSEVLYEMDSQTAKESPLENVESPLSNAEALLIEKTSRKHFDECVEGLTEMQRQTLMLRAMSQLGFDEIAQATSSSIASVKSALFRAKNALIDCMRGKGEHEE